MDKKDLSLIILTYNSEKNIYDCLDSIFRVNDINNRLEIIVVDNNSTHKLDLKKQLLLKYPIRYIQNINNLGYGAGNNVGIEVASSDIILIMNPDVTLRDFSFSKIVKSYQEMPHLGIQGFLQYESKDKISISYLMNIPNIFNYIFQKICLSVKYYNQRYFCFSGACFSFRKSALSNIGFFSENIFLYSEERYLQMHLNKTRVFKSKLDKKQSYIHPMHERKLNQSQIDTGLESYLYVIDSLKLNKKTAINKMLNLERLFLLKSHLLRNKLEIKIRQNKILKLKDIVKKC